MMKGTSGMGIRKHRTSGKITKSPRLRMQERLDAQKNERKKKDTTEWKPTIKDLLTKK